MDKLLCSAVKDTSRPRLIRHSFYPGVGQRNSFQRVEHRTSKNSDGSGVVTGDQTKTFQRD